MNESEWIPLSDKNIIHMNRKENQDKFLGAILYHGENEPMCEVSDIRLDDLYVSKKCAARMLGVCYRTIERWYNMGYIERVRIGGRIYFSKNEVLRMMQAYEQGIDVLSRSNRPQTLAELLAKHECRLRQMRR